MFPEDNKDISHIKPWLKRTLIGIVAAGALVQLYHASERSVTAPNSTPDAPKDPYAVSTNVQPMREGAAVKYRINIAPLEIR